MAADAELSALDAAGLIGGLVGRLGGAFMLEPATFAAGAELGVPDPWQWYLVGRFGALGRVAPDVVEAVAVFFPPERVHGPWEAACAAVDPAAAARCYAALAADRGRERWRDLADAEAGRLVELLDGLVDAAPVLGAPLFGAWRRVPRPDDPLGRLGLLVHVLREHRGGLHGLAVLAEGLAPLGAIVSGPYGYGNAKLFGWPKPYPDAEPFRDLRAAAEARTDRMAAPAYDLLSADERREVLSLLGRVAALE